MQIRQLPLVDVLRQQIDLREGDEILSAAFRDGGLCLFVMGDETKPITEKETIIITRTEVSCPFRLAKFIGTVISNQFVWHVFLAP